MSEFAVRRNPQVPPTQRQELVEFSKFNVTVRARPRVMREGTCTIIHPEDCNLPLDIWDAMPRPCDETLTIVTAPLAEKTTGGAFVTPDMRARAGQLSFLGIVLAIGSACWQREKWMTLEPVEDQNGVITYRRRLMPPPCAIGDTIIFGRQSALALPVHARDATASHQTVDFRFLHSQAVNGVAPCPDQMQQCAAFGL